MRLCSIVAAFAIAPSMNTVDAQQQFDPAKIAGRDTCRSCHVSEHRAWANSSHRTKAWRLLDEPKAAKIAETLGVTELKGASLCTRCHGTQQLEHGQLQIQAGNACESCHGAAGGVAGWLKLHYDYGQGGGDNSPIEELLANRQHETKQHRLEREQQCRQAGMNRSADVFELARSCLECHLVPDEQLVAAGHPVSARFEFVEWAQGEVRHNFLLDRGRNAEAPTNWTAPDRHGPGRTVEGRKRLMYVAGQLADLAVSLRIRSLASSTKRGSLGATANSRISRSRRNLQKLEIAELAPALAAIDHITRRGLRTVTADDRQLYSAAADAVAKAAQVLVAQHRDGSKLPASIKIPAKSRGQPFQG